MKNIRTTPSNKPSLEQVIESELAVLYRVAKTLTRNADDAEDIVGQTLYLAAKSWSSFDGAYPRSWLIKIMRNEFIALTRKKSAKMTVAIDSIGEPSTEGYWEDIDWSLAGADIAEELAKLPEEYQMAVSLCDVEELSYEEAALAMDCPTGTVRSRLYRGRNLLRSRLVKRLGDFAPQS